MFNLSSVKNSVPDTAKERHNQNQLKQTIALVMELICR